MLTTLAIIAAILALLAYMFVRYMSATHNTFKKMGIDNPPPNPIIGNFGNVFKYGIFEVQKVFYNQYIDKKVYGWYDSRRPTMIVKDLDMVKDIFVKNFNCFVDRHSLFEVDPPFSDNLLNLKGEHWKHVRNIVTPTFSSSRLKKMAHHIERNTKIMLENLQALQESGTEVEARDFLSAFTLDVIASTGFGLEINTLKNPNNPFATEAKKVINPNPLLFSLILLIPSLTKLFSRLGLSILPQKSLQYFVKVVEAAIEERKRDGLEGKVNDFLDLVMNAEKETGEPHKELTRSELYGQALIFIFAGYDTVSTVLSFTLFFIAMHPDCCKRVQEEIDEKCGQTSPNYDNVQSLAYLDMCINESIRLAPPAFLINRVCVKDTEVQGVKFPKDMVVAVPVYAIHTDPEIWPEPDKFDPKRFTPENKESRHPYAHLPFGQGPRNCIGMRLALLEIKIALATIFQKFTPTRCSKSVYPIQLSKMGVRANDGLWIKFAARK
uniref:Cytochrome P450 3a7 n=1 Tax=Physella acuta TaxID=109671 RepID=A0A346FQX2_PHYAT|nr:cytochrome P450 3a7 [Physella acuta]